MFENEAKPLLLKKMGSNEKIVSTVLRFFGIGESQLEADLEDIIDAQTNPTIAPLAADGEVTLRLTAKHADEKETERLLKETEAVILERVGEFFYGYDDTSLVKELSIACKEKGITISAAESFTGGLFSEWLTDHSGLIKIICRGRCLLYKRREAECAWCQEGNIRSFWGGQQGVRIRTG